MALAPVCFDSGACCADYSSRDYCGRSRCSYAEVASAFPGLDSLSQLSAELDNLIMECHEPGWDGYGAEPISIEAYGLARKFIESFPAGIPTPSLSADPDGCVTFQWGISPRRLVLVSVHPEYRLDYAALIGTAKSYGSEPFFDTLPNSIRDIISRVYA